MKTSRTDRRIESRQPVQGDIRLRKKGAITAPFMGRLVDLSPHGFRSRHGCLTLVSGDRVDYEYQGRNGTGDKRTPGPRDGAGAPEASNRGADSLAQSFSSIISQGRCTGDVDQDRR